MTNKFGETCQKLIDEGKCDNDCCGFIVFDTELWTKCRDKVDKAGLLKVEHIEGKTLAYTEDDKCPFLDRTKHKCRIYENRPEVCRNYGLKEDLQCSYIKMNGNVRSPAKQRRMQRIINHQSDDKMRGLQKKYGIKR